MAVEKRLITQAISNFDAIRHIEYGVEFWFARDLQELLGYSEWRNFKKVIEKSVISCEASKTEPSHHFVEVNKMVETGVTTRAVSDYKLTRYACYLIAQNGDSSKQAIALAQSYFATQTRKQELIEEHLNYIERNEARDRLKLSEKRLSQNIYERGVDQQGFGRIRSKGDSALFGGHSTSDMKARLGVKENRALADFLPTLTIAAKNLATEMTNHNVETNDLQGELPITEEHVQNNSTIRAMLGERGIKPEDLPPAPDLQKLSRKVKSKEKQLTKKHQ